MTKLTQPYKSLPHGPGTVGGGPAGGGVIGGVGIGIGGPDGLGVGVGVGAAGCGGSSPPRPLGAEGGADSAVGCLDAPAEGDASGASARSIA